VVFSEQTTSAERIDDHFFFFASVTSYLRKKYESPLRGKKEQFLCIKTQKGNIKGFLYQQLE
jgi:hypothetical protein